MHSLHMLQGAYDEPQHQTTTNNATSLIYPIMIKCYFTKDNFFPKEFSASSTHCVKFIMIHF